MTEEHHEIRRVQPLEGEHLWLVLHERDGFLEEAPPEDDCLLLSNQRLIGFSRGESRRRRVLLSLHDVDAVEITDLAKNLRPLVTGGLLVLAALAIAWLAAAFNMGGFLPWLIEGVLVLLGAITASTYFVAEETAMITFRTRATEVSLPLRTPQALRDAYTMAQGFFQAKAGQVPTAGPESYPPVPPVDAMPWQERSEPSQGTDSPDPDTTSHPLESAQREFPEQPADVPLPGMTPHQQESTQAEGWKDV